MRSDYPVQTFSSSCSMSQRRCASFFFLQIRCSERMKILINTLDKIADVFAGLLLVMLMTSPMWLTYVAIRWG